MQPERVQVVFVLEDLDSRKQEKTDSEGNRINKVETTWKVYGNGKIKNHVGVDWSQVCKLAINPFLIMSRIQGYVLMVMGTMGTWVGQI